MTDFWTLDEQRALDRDERTQPVDGVTAWATGLLGVVAIVVGGLLLAFLLGLFAAALSVFAEIGWNVVR